MYLLSSRKTKLWRGYRVCPVRKYVRMVTFCHYSSTYIFWRILMYPHTNIGYDNISSKFDFQGPALKVKVTVAI